ncbi:MAG: hypothetical protein AB7N71_02395 [Phycisphaerae bacterium]
MNHHPSAARFRQSVSIGLPMYLVLACPLLSAHAEPLSHSRQNEILQTSLTAFDEGIAQFRDDPNAAQKNFRAAIDGFEALTAAGVESAALRYNLGNAYFRANDLGRAVLNYRRALENDPNHARARANLDFVRARVAPHLSDTGNAGIWKSLSFLNVSLSAQTRLWLCALAGIVGWGALLLRARRRAPALMGVGIVGALIAMTLASSLWWQISDRTTRPPAVVVQDNVTIRLGRGDGSDPAMREPLGPGVELRVLQTRAGWLEVKLANGLEGWIPESAALLL